MWTAPLLGLPGSSLYLGRVQRVSTYFPSPRWNSSRASPHPGRQCWHFISPCWYPSFLRFGASCWSCSAFWKWVSEKLLTCCLSLFDCCKVEATLISVLCVNGETNQKVNQQTNTLLGYWGNTEFIHGAKTIVFSNDYHTCKCTNIINIAKIKEKAIFFIESKIYRKDDWRPHWFYGLELHKVTIFVPLLIMGCLGFPFAN